MHTDLVRAAAIGAMIALCYLVVRVFIWILGALGQDIVLRCTSCNQPAVLKWSKSEQFFDLSVVQDWLFSPELGWRCPDCGDGPPQRWPDLFPQDPKPKDDIH